MNRDDDLLEALGAEAQALDEEDDRLWEAVQRGDADALPSEAALDALKPLDDAEMEDIVSGLLGGAVASGGPEGVAAQVAEVEAVDAMAVGAAKATEGAAGALGAGVGGAPATAEGAQVVSITSARRWAGPVAALVAIAAAVMLFVATPDHAALPRYALDVRSGEKVVRSDDAPVGDVTAYSKGAVFDFVLVPAAKVTEDVALAAFLIGDAGPRAWDAPAQRLDGGTFRVRGTVGDQLDLEPGTYRVVFFVGARDALPSAATEDAPGAQRFEATIRVR